MNNKFTQTSSNIVTHTGFCPLTAKKFVRRYWVHPGGGWAYLDDTIDGSCPGDLGKPLKWRCREIYLMESVKYFWDVERARSHKARVAIA